MARVLAYTSPARGHLYPVTPILDELRRRGHEIALRTLASQVELMRSRGFDAAPLDPAIERIGHEDYGARTPLGAQKRAMRVFCRRAEHEAPDLRRAIADAQPDVLLVDIATWGALAVAEALGGPWASWCPYPLPLPSRDAPPFGPGLRPARGSFGRLRDAALRPIVFGSLDRIIGPRVNEVRERVGVAPINDAREMFGTPPVLLYLTAEPFEYPRCDWPDNVRLVGACDWDPPAEPPGWLDAIDQPSFAQARAVARKGTRAARDRARPRAVCPTTAALPARALKVRGGPTMRTTGNFDTLLACTAGVTGS